MKSKIITSDSPNDLQHQLNTFLEFKSVSESISTVQFSTTPVGVHGVVMYSVLVIWGKV